ncbi:MAG: ABC transporter ATP-binding protein/permease [Ruminococcus sp.]|nr:ABC transporter ATP-binding protein/permease [Ruminococcus sp.]
MADNSLKQLLKYLFAYKAQLLAALVLAVVNVAATLYAPIITGDAVDLIVGKGNVDFEGLKPLLSAFAVTIAVACLSQYFMNLCLNKATYFAVRDLRNDAFDKFSRLPLKYIDSNPKGEIISRLISDIEQISDGLILGFAQLFTGVITIIGTFFFMLSINVRIALVVVVLTPLSLFAARFIAKNTFNFFKEQTTVRGELTSFVEETTGNQKTLKAFSHEARSQEDFEKLNQQFKSVSVRAIFFSSLTNPTTRFINGLVYAAVGIIGAFSIISGSFSVGALSCFLTYANQYTKPFNEISSVVTELQGAFACAKRVMELINEPQEAEDKANAVVLENPDGTMKAESVYFSYREDVPLIESFNLDVKTGQRIAIVGPTGCGKTTFINLLMRFYDVDGGSITLSGVNIKDCTRDSVRAAYGMVLQDTWLMQGTVRENISYSKPDADISEVEAAAKAAHCDGFIRRLENGYDTVISSDGGTLSAGQKQLLCIARVMLSLPQMLILDEATSSIDTRTEILVQQTFAEMMEGRTSFIIAHRLSTVRNADCIIVMDAGHIIEQGTHEQLMSKNGFYAKLYNSQFES